MISILTLCFQILEQFSNIIVAYLCGHYHSGGFCEQNGMKYFTLKGILEAPEDNNCFSIFHIYHNRVEVVGFGTENSRGWKI